MGPEAQVAIAVQVDVVAAAVVVAAEGVPEGQAAHPRVAAAIAKLHG